MTQGRVLDSSHLKLDLGASVGAIAWGAEAATFALGDGTVVIVRSPGDVGRTQAHRGPVLAACQHPDGASVITGGDDGSVRRLGMDGEQTEIGVYPGEWVNHLVASARSRVIVAAVGKHCVVWPGDAPETSHAFAFSSTIGGLALDREGAFLAVSHYDGATVLDPRVMDSGRVAFEWSGSHLHCTLSADARYLITALQETGLHGWKLPFGGDMRMSGYRAKTHSFSWSFDRLWLATSGDTDAILWPPTAMNATERLWPRAKRKPTRAPVRALLDGAKRQIVDHRHMIRIKPVPQPQQKHQRQARSGRRHRC